MYGDGIKSTGAGGTTITVLPNTGGFRPVYILGITLFVMGVIMLLVAGTGTVRQLMKRG
jgi:hypothetical protein